MLTSYPSKNFFTDVKNTLLKNERFRIAIKKGWRSRLLAQEVESWILQNLECRLMERLEKALRCFATCL